MKVLGAINRRLTRSATAGISNWRRPTPFSRREFCFASSSSNSRSSGGGDVGVALPPEHEQIKEWIVFSDLHVSRQTCSVCLDVLKFVKAEAEKRRAGVIFLGDFWHARGQLPVEPLNAVLDVFSSWDHPTVMIAGNHDQVNLGGTVHALEPIAKAADSVSVFSEPTVWKNALWLPYRRRKDELEEALSMYKDEVKAIFAHVDVVGADFNEAFQSSEGIQPSLFPLEIPTWTGHYHKPHTIRGTNINYVGSPYQLSFGESNQAKYLNVLDSSTWERVDKIRIDIGPRHFILDAEKDRLPQDQLRAGDRVRVLNCTEEQMTELPASILSGVTLDVVPRTNRKEEVRIEDAEQMKPQQLFQIYSEKAKMRGESIGQALDILSEVESESISSLSSSHVTLNSVSLSGYGPFQKPIQYQFNGEGPRIRIVSGSNEDDLGSTSNGSGKTSLVMAPIWAFTGRTEIKGEHSWRKRSLTNSDIVNDQSRAATVLVDGEINGTPFELERSVTKRTLKKLRFVYGGEDLTCQEARMTQAKIDFLVNTKLLGRIMCHDQESINAFLSASDRQMKELLGAIVDLEFWEAAKELSKERLREARETLDRAEAEEKVCQRVLDKTLSHLASLEAQCSNWEEESSKQIEALRAELHGYENDLVDATTQLAVLKCAAKRAVLVAQSDSPQMEKDSEVLETAKLMLSAQEIAVEELEECLNTLILRRIDAEKRLSISDYALKQSISKCESFEKLGGSDTEMVCDKCNQVIDEETYRSHLEEFEMRVTDRERDQEVFLKERQEILQEEELAKKKLAQEKLKLASAQKEVASRAASIGMEKRQHQNFSGKIREFIHKFDFVPEAEETGGGADEIDLAELYVSIQSASNQHDYLSRVTLDVTKQIKEFQENPFLLTVKKVQAQVHDEEGALELSRKAISTASDRVRTISEADSAFSTTGVQSFALESALKQLQEVTAANLEILSSNSLKLQLSATRSTKSKKALNSELESINKIIYSRNSQGKFIQRSLSQLSGGERRRLGISLALGYSRLASVRSGLSSDLLIFDEIMLHLDDEGCRRLLSLIHDIPQSTILLVAQPHSAVYDLVDAKDIVVKERDTSRVTHLY